MGGKTRLLPRLNRTAAKKAFGVQLVSGIPSSPVNFHLKLTESQVKRCTPNKPSTTPI